jgi:hypothetical protein
MLTETGLVYCYYNTISHKRYIGFTGHENTRRIRWNCKGVYVSYSSAVDIARREYPKDSWEYSILEKDCTPDREKYWISFYKSNDPEFGYNIASGGIDGWLGLHHTPETKALLSVQKLGKKTGPLSEETRRKMSEAQKGLNKRPRTDDEKVHQSFQISGRRHMNNSVISVMVKPEDVQSYLDRGFIFGRLYSPSEKTRQLQRNTMKNRVHVHNSEHELMIHPEDVQSYVDKGYIIGIR